MKKIVILILFIPFLFGCSQKENKFYPEIYEQEMNGIFWKIVESQNCSEELRLYFSKDEISVYFLGIDDIFVKDENNIEIPLSNFFGSIYETMSDSVQKLLVSMEEMEEYKNDEVTFYKKDKLILVKFNTKDGNHDIYMASVNCLEILRNMINKNLTSGRD